MGTRADFYKGMNPSTMQWLGSIGWDGYPQGHGHPAKHLRNSMTEAEYDLAIAGIIDDTGTAFTHPDQGWPWPWSTSHATDYAYTWHEGFVYVSNFGSPWKEWADFLAGDPDPADFPDMTTHQNVRYDHGSGLVVIGLPNA